jgi:hypothetical protein
MKNYNCDFVVSISGEAVITLLADFLPDILITSATLALNLVLLTITQKRFVGWCSLFERVRFSLCMR